MKTLSESVKTLAITLVFTSAFLFCGSGETGAMDRDKLVEVTRSALQEQDVLQQVAYYAYQHDGKIGEAVKGDYQIKPERIIPWSVSDKKAVSVVRVKATRGDKAKMGIKPSGWKEEWLWVDEKGGSYTMRINFTTSPSGGTDWTIEG